MSIYKGNNYRKIYKQHYGPIPKDDEGRRYDIHHIDGNSKNNDPNNLKAVSIQEHYNIHYFQDDWGACFLIAKRMKLPQEVISDLASKANLKRVANGTHFLLNNPMQRENNLKRVQDGTHPFTKPEFQSMVQQKLLAEGKHQSQVEWTCPHCKRSGKGQSNFTRYHSKGENCKFSEEYWKIVPKEKQPRKKAIVKKRGAYTEEDKERIYKSRRGRKQDPDVVAKRIASLKGRTRTAETKAKMSAARQGKIISIESRLKSSETKRGRAAKMTAEERKQQFGHIKTEEECIAISKRMKENWAKRKGLS